MNNVSTNFKELQQYQGKTTIVKKDNPGFFKKLGAGIVGLTVTGAATQIFASPVILSSMNKLYKLNSSLTKDEIEILNKAGEKVLKDSGLEKKGVVLLRDLPKDIKSSLVKLGNFFKKELPKNIGIKLHKFFRTIIPYYSIKQGRNACYIAGENTIIATNKIALSQFHELGHAMNEHSRFGNILQKLRLDVYKAKKNNNIIAKLLSLSKAKLPNMIAKVKIPTISKLVGLMATTITLVSIFKNKKAKDEKPQGFFDKATTFIKNNVGKLTFLTILPMVLEEGIASFKGEKAVKNLVNADLFKKIKLSNRLGLITYVTTAVAAGVGAYYASKIRDNIAQPNLNK